MGGKNLGNWNPWGLQTDKVQEEAHGISSEPPETAKAVHIEEPKIA